MIRSLSIIVISAVLGAAGCERSSSQPSPGAASDARRAGTPTPAAGHSGAVVELGETSVDGKVVRASRDAGEIKAGGDAPIDVWIDGGLGDATAVRFWIGTQDAKTSIKAKAAVENGHWHTHAEIPDPLPADSRLWVAIEHKDGKERIASFELKR